MRRADSTVSKITSSFHVSKIESAALRALPHVTVVIREKQCDGCLGGLIVKIARPVFPIARLGIITHNERADLLKMPFVERDWL